MRCEVSTTFPSTLPASAAFARPGPIDAATSATETGAANRLMLPSGRVMLGMAILQGRIRLLQGFQRKFAFAPGKKKVRASRTFFAHSKDRRTCALAFL